ncbi:MAG: hypothetical protein AAFS10_02670 [Myxococcota bacterium]
MTHFTSPHRPSIIVALMCVLPCGLVACTTSSSGSGIDKGQTDSETHWLSSCTADSDCGPSQAGQLSCVCNVCTQPCDTPNACEALAPEASCSPIETIFAQCSQPAATSVCVPSCSTDADCVSLGVDWACNTEVSSCAPAQSQQEEQQEETHSEEGLCQSTGGQWFANYCGGATCGVPPDCTAPIGGCNCGPTSSFEPSVGCVLDPQCPVDDTTLCESSGGRWDEGGCGHYFCAWPTDCPGVESGCDCGIHANFVEGQGCVRDERCGPHELTPEMLCESSGGRWDGESCGDYFCGTFPVCLAIDPGCDCGPDANFVEGQGCVRDERCDSLEPTPEEMLCESTGGSWDTGCDGFFCGITSDCLVAIPGCNCGPDANFVEGQGCVRDERCDFPEPEPAFADMLCESGGGRWDEGSCGDYVCGVFPACLAVDPGCDCGPTANFVDGRGCVRDPQCSVDETTLCSMTGGRWDDESCGHYSCGWSPECLAIDPGCDCGEGRTFAPGLGCAADLSCDRMGSRTAVIDPNTITFGSLPVNSIRYAVTGYAPEQGMCVGIIWLFEADSSLTFCGRDAPSEPYVVTRPSTENNCGALADFGGNVELLTPPEADHCIDFSNTDTMGRGNVHLAVDVAGEAFTGTIVFDNRADFVVSPTFLSMGYQGDTPQTLYAQTTTGLGTPGWVSITDTNEEAVGIFERCDIPQCGSNEGVCGLSFAQVTPFLDETTTGGITVVWDGYINRFNDNDQCMERVPAPSGQYKAQFCYGDTFADADSGTFVDEPRCTFTTFTYPTASVVGLLDED